MCRLYGCFYRGKLRAVGNYEIATEYAMSMRKHKLDIMKLPKDLNINQLRAYILQIYNLNTCHTIYTDTILTANEKKELSNAVELCLIDIRDNLDELAILCGAIADTNILESITEGLETVDGVLFHTQTTQTYLDEDLCLYNIVEDYIYDSI